jgi:hypothetical protein
MDYRIQCRTLFDITATGVKGHFNRNRVPFEDNVNQSITDVDSWTRSRNQQRNWETLNQIISLRTMTNDITMPRKMKINNRDYWYFEFSVEQPASFESPDDPLGVLKQDCKDVPMLTGLDEQPGIEQLLVPDTNINFETV